MKVCTHQFLGKTASICAAFLACRCGSAGALFTECRRYTHLLRTRSPVQQGKPHLGGPHHSPTHSSIWAGDTKSNQLDLCPLVWEIKDVTCASWTRWAGCWRSFIVGPEYFTPAAEASPVLLEQPTMKPGTISLVAVLLLVGAASHAAAGRRRRGTAAPRLSHRPAPRSEHARACPYLGAPIGNDC